MKKIVVSILIFAFLISCSPKQSQNKFIAAVEKATRLMERGKLYEAETVLQNSLIGENPQPSPFVKDSTLFFYAQGMSQTLMTMMASASFFTRMKNGEIDSLNEVGELSGLDKKMYDAYQETPFTNTAAIAADIPQVYLTLGINYVNMRNLDEAKESLNKSIELYPQNGTAWAELIYVVMQEKEYDKAKELIDQALEIEFMDDFGKAAVLRKLGWIQIEDSELDKAEATYLKSIELYDHPSAQSELKYIRSIK